MWSLKITTEQRYKYFEPILPDIQTDIKLFWDLMEEQRILEDNTMAMYVFTTESFFRKFKSFIIERTLDNQYQITFYE